MRKLFALLLIAALTWLCFEFSRGIFRLYGQADADLKLGVITAFGSALAFIVNNAVQSSRERKARLFENKREAYSKFFEFFFSIFAAQRSETPLTDEQMATNFREFTQDVMTWGSAETINAIAEYQRVNLANSVNVPHPNDFKRQFLPTERLLRALRKDLGHSDGPMESFGLTKLILRAEEHDKLK